MSDEDEKKEISLSSFIEDHHKLLTTLGVFSALTVVAANLKISWIGTLLSFLFLSASILIWFELLTKFPSKKGGWRLTWFENVLSYSALFLTIYWFWQLRQIYPNRNLWAVFTIPIALGLLIGLSSLIKRFDLFNRFFGTVPGGKQPIRYILYIFLVLVSLFLAAVLAFKLGPIIDRILDSLGKARGLT